MSGRAYYSQALDAAREADDHHAAAVALGYTAELTHAEGLSTAALDHLTAAATYSAHAPGVSAWLASIEATIHSDCGNDDGAREALNRAQVPGGATSPTATDPTLAEHGVALIAVVGHVHLRAGNYPTARKVLIAALGQVPQVRRRARALILIDLAFAELCAGNAPDACRNATAAADLLFLAPHSVGTVRLRNFRAAAARAIGSRASRVLDAYLAKLPA